MSRTVSELPDWTPFEGPLHAKVRDLLAENISPADTYKNVCIHYL